MAGGRWGGGGGGGGRTASTRGEFVQRVDHEPDSFIVLCWNVRK